MILNKDEIISAQVVLLSRSGKRVEKDTVITSENIDEYIPPEDSARLAIRTFGEWGFKTGLLVGNSFSITATAGLFMSTFHTEIQRNKKGDLVSVAKNGEQSEILPIADLPSDLTEIIQTVTFIPAPDFGPTDF